MTQINTIRSSPPSIVKYLQTKINAAAGLLGAYISCSNIEAMVWRLKKRHDFHYKIIIIGLLARLNRSELGHDSESIQFKPPNSVGD